MEKAPVEKRRKHSVAEKAPWIIAILAILVGMFGIVLVTSPVSLLVGIMDMSTVTVIYDLLSILIALILLALYIRWFRPEYEGDFHTRGTGRAWKLLLPFLLFWGIWGLIKSTVISYCDEIGIDAVANGFRAGFVEEITYRGIAVSILLRKYHDRHNIWIPSVSVAVLFGLTHLMNLTAGEDLLIVLLTAVFATALGVYLGVVYTLSGNLWLIALVHTAYDIWSFAINVDALPDWLGVAEILITAALAVWSLFYLKRHSEEGSRLWSRRWNR